MGYIKNHAIVVTATYGDYIKDAYAKAREIFGDNVSSITPVAVNGSQSFLIPPDGSKEGWHESADGDLRRAQFKDWLRSQVYEDFSSPLAWVEIAYPGDDMQATVEDDSKALYRSKRQPTK